MAAQIAHDVVNQAQSTGASEPVGDIATTTTSPPASSGLDASAFAPSQSLAHSLDIDDTLAPSRDLAKSPLSEAGLLAEASGGSDTDSSKPDAASRPDGLLGHARSNSVKKPTTFKSVSVTKNFLAKAAVGSPIVKSGDKAAPSAPSTPISAAAKPRLVAKSALGGLTSRISTKASGAGAGPDASQVWNKNRPVPPPAPRHFTDEELKLQYGIHMATRLPADEDSKESKWADIDDDEDDWAPETVTWLDGTKSTLDHSDPKALEAMQPSQVPRPPPVIQPPVAETHVPVQPSLSSKTILKPGAHLLSQAKQSGGLVLKGGLEKTSSSANSAAAPAPAKSPWAALPPVDKVSPIQFVPPAQPQRFTRDPAGFDGFQAASSPKEIQVDDFNRVYDHPRHRELFNSQSGRFEPAAEGRKGPVRQEPGQRQPAVLQRHPYTQHMPSDSSTSPQSQRPSNESVPWSHNRAGSSSRPQDPMTDISSTAPDQDSHPQDPPADPANSSTPSADVEDASLSPEDRVKVQQKLMREKIEAAKLAKQRRMEAEEQEERARKERLRLKVEALATTNPPPPEVQDKSAEPVANAVSPQAAKPVHVASPPKPPVPTAAGEVAQYGMMKVHHPQTVKKPNILESSLGTQSNLGQPVEKRHFSQTQSKSSSAEQLVRSSQPADKPLPPADASRTNVLNETSPWRTGAPPETYSNWGTGNSNNVWGPPQSRDRALGNGIFDTAAYRGLQGSLQGSRSIDQSNASAAHGPGPIGPPLSRSGLDRNPTVEVSGDRDLGLDVTESIIPSHIRGHEVSQVFPSQLSTSHQHLQYSHTGSIDNPQQNHPHSLGYQRNVGFKSQAPGLIDSELEVAAKWNQLRDETVRQKEESWKQESDRIKSIQDQLDREQRERQRTNFRPDHHQLQNDSSAGRTPHLGQPATSQALPKVNLGSSLSAVPSQRESRFFPRPAGGLDLPEKSSSPPPPEQSSLDGGHTLPRVNIPKVPVVKLPPSLPTTTPIASLVPSINAAQKAGGNTTGWQHKIDELLRKGKSGVSVNTSSRAPLDVLASASATVSLPAVRTSRTSLLFSTDRSSAPVSKVTEDDLFPSPEFGSTPTIRLPPKGFAYDKNIGAPQFFRTQHAVIIRTFKEVERDFATSIPQLAVDSLLKGSGNSITIKLQNMVLAKQVSKSSSPYRGNTPRGQGTSPRVRRGGDSSTSLGRTTRRPSSQQVTGDIPSNTSTRGSLGRGGQSRGGSVRGPSHTNIRQSNSSTPFAKRNVSAPIGPAA